MRTSTIQLPLWAEWLKALAPVIAVLTSAFAVYISVLTFRLSRQIANWQTSVARAQLRQNVYDRRFKIYEATKTLLVIYQNNDRLSTEEYLDYRRSTTDAVFLLDDNVVRYLEHIGERVRRFLLLQEQIKENVSGEDAYHRRVNEHAEIGTWFLRNLIFYSPNSNLLCDWTNRKPRLLRFREGRPLIFQIGAYAALLPCKAAKFGSLRSQLGLEMFGSPQLSMT